jgi:hypothetical protein
MCFSRLQLVFLIKFLNQVPRVGFAMLFATPPYLTLSVQSFRHISFTILRPLLEPFCDLCMLSASVYVVGRSALGGFEAVKRNLKHRLF